MSPFDIYRHTQDNSARFALGRSGSNPLIVIGANPSRATDVASDHTIDQIERIVGRWDYDGFVMLNLYPAIATDPKELPKKADEALILLNMLEINMIVDDIVSSHNKSPSVWAAWGNLIDTRHYLADSLNQIARSTALSQCAWWKYGELTKTGNPRHPSRKSIGLNFVTFNVDEYLSGR